MKQNQLFKKYYDRLRFEGLIKSLIWGVIVGFSLGSIFVFMSIAFNGFATVGNYDASWLIIFLIALGIWLVATAVAMPLFYVLRFKPDKDLIAARIDSVGLEERMITMNQFEGDDSFMAGVQRADAKEKLTAVSPKRLKIKAFMLVPTIIASVLMVVFVLSLVFVNVTVDTPLAWESYNRVVQEEREPDPDPEFEYFWIEYLTMGGGYIYGDVFQVVVLGEDGRTVVATAIRGNAFWRWTFEPDEVRRYMATRQERGVTGIIVHLAEFVPDDEGDGDDESDYEDEEPQPRDPDDDEDEEFNPNVIENGRDDFRYNEERFREFLAEALATLAAGGDIPVSLRLMIEAYFALLAA